MFVAAVWLELLTMILLFSELYFHPIYIYVEASANYGAFRIHQSGGEVLELCFFPFVYSKGQIYYIYDLFLHMDNLHNFKINKRPVNIPCLLNPHP